MEVKDLLHSKRLTIEEQRQALKLYLKAAGLLTDQLSEVSKQHEDQHGNNDQAQSNSEVINDAVSLRR